MAKMIPPQIAAKAPQGEQMLFRKLRDDPATKEWIVFHSFDIRRHVTQSQGEADLIVAVPGQGVLCIEVKGCGITRKEGLWTYHYDPPRTSTTGPFRQASDAAHSVRKHASSRDALLLPVLFHSAVFFTEIDFRESSIEWEPWQVVGKTELLRNPVSRVVMRILDAAHGKLRALRPVPSWYGERSRPSSKQMDRLVAVLRPDFEYTVVGGMSFELAEQAIRRFTEEQFQALDLIEENRRVLFKGPAGTGKTLLAVEAARRAVRMRRNVALLCFNNLLGSWLKQVTQDVASEAGDLGGSFFAGTASALMLKISGVQVPPAAGHSFWSDELPARATEVLMCGNDATPAFDLLIVDEAQDLLSDCVLDVLELATAGGFAGGRWALFGDFEKQAIYANSNAQPGLERLKARTGTAFTVYPLRVNCRNSRRIADAVTLASGLVPGYSRVLVDVEAADVEPVFYRSASHQIEQLEATLHRLTRQFPPDQIVVLSMCAEAGSCAAAASGKVQQPRLIALRSDQGKEMGIRFTTVHAFKGMEAAAIVLTDVENLDHEQSRSLLYVGMTRARLALVLIMAERVRSRYDSLLLEGYRARMLEARK